MNKLTISIITTFLLFSSVFLWVYPYFFTKTPPSQQNIIANVDRKVANIGFNDLKKINIPDNTYRINFSLNGNIPKVAKIFEYQKASLSDIQITEINNKLGLKIASTVEKTPVGRFILSSKPNESISYYPDEAWYIYTNMAGIENTDPAKVRFKPSDNLDEYKNYAENEFRKNYGNFDGYTYKGYKYRTYPGPHYEITSSKETAGLLEFIYEYEINGLAILDDINATIYNSISIYIAKDKTIKRIEVKEPGRVLSETGTHTLKTYKELVEDIKNGRAVPVATEITENDNIISANIKEAKLSYLFRENKLIPIFILTGTLQTRSGFTTDCVWYVNAVSKL